MPRQLDPQKVGGPPGQLYHVEDDPAETQSVWNDYPAVVEALSELLARVQGNDA